MREEYALGAIPTVYAAVLLYTIGDNRTPSASKPQNLKTSNPWHLRPKAFTKIKG